MKPRTLFVGVHAGPYSSILPLERPLASFSPLFLLDGMALSLRKNAGLSCLDFDAVITGSGSLDLFLRTQGIQAILCGTSDGLMEGNLEESVCVAATELDIPVFVVEDFPGNFRNLGRFRLDGLFVEDDSVCRLHESRGVAQGIALGLGNPRYDALRQIDRFSLREKTRSQLGVAGEKVVLWIGQPDGGNSYKTIERMLPTVLSSGAILLFKAHPRDTLYASGAYKELLPFSDVCLDVTDVKDTMLLCCAADLVVTQFSSVGVEAGYLGTPVLYVLFDDLGMAYLRKYKGYEVVLWAREDCAFLLRSSDSIQEVFKTALFNDAARSIVRQRFQHRFNARPPSASAIAAIVKRSLRGNA